MQNRASGYGFGVLLIAALTGCMRTPVRPLKIGDRLRVASGSYQIDRREDGRTDIEIHVYQLREPDRVDKDAQTYMAWLEPLGEKTDAVPVGPLHIDRDRHAEIDATTEQRAFQVFVTAEHDPNVTHPTGDRLLWAKVHSRAE